MTNDELLDRLKDEAPKPFTTEELLNKPSDAIARHQLLIAGWEQAIEKIEDLSLDDSPITDHAAGTNQEM